MTDKGDRAFCARCEDLLLEGRCRGCCTRCEGRLVDGACPRCLPHPASGLANLLHEVGELVELRASSSIANINAFLSRGWILLRIADSSYGYLLGWRRDSGSTHYPAWYEAELREREVLLEALRASGDDDIALEPD